MEQCNPFDLNKEDPDKGHLFNMVTKEIIPDKVQHDILTMAKEQNIEDHNLQSVSTCYICQVKSGWS